MAVDVIGVVKGADDLSTVVGKQSQKEIKKRDIHLVDSGQVQIRLTLWGSDVSVSRDGYEPNVYLSLQPDTNIYS